jgi:hypothetical protein
MVASGLCLRRNRQKKGQSEKKSGFESLFHRKTHTDLLTRAITASRQRSWTGKIARKQVFHTDA